MNSLNKFGPVLAVLWIAAAQQPPPAPPDDVRPAGALELHRPVEREIGPGQVDLFTVDVAAGQFLRAVAQQNGVDVIVQILDPDGHSLVVADRSSGVVAPEAASAIAPRAGTMRILVRKNPRSGETGRYAMELTDLRDPTGKDHIRIAAEARLFAGSDELRAGDAANLRKAAADIAAALQSFAEVEDVYEQGLCYGSLGLLSSELGEKDKALDAFQKALGMRRASGDRSGEASTLNNLGLLWASQADWPKAIESIEQALTIRHELGDRGNELAGLTSLADAFEKQGNPAQALQYYQQRLPLERAAADRMAEALLLRFIGRAELALGDKQKAEESWKQALAIYRAEGGPAGRSGESATLQDLYQLHSLSVVPSPTTAASPVGAPGSNETAVQLVAQTGHALSVSAIAFSADERFVLTATQGSPYAAILWSVEGGKELRRFEGHTNSIGSVAFLPDGKRVVTASLDDTIRTWDAETGKELSRLTSTRHFGRMAVSSDGETVAVFEPIGGKSVWLLNLRSGKLVQSFEGHSAAVRGMAFSPDGKWIATASADHSARLWEIASGREIRRFIGHTSPVNAVAFSANGKILVTGSGRTIFDGRVAVPTENEIGLWDVDSGKQIRTMDAAGPVLSVAVSPDGHYLASGGGELATLPGSCPGCETRLIDLASGRVLSHFQNTRQVPVDVVAFSPLKGLLARTEYSEEVLVDPASGQEVSRLKGYAFVDYFNPVATNGRFTFLAGPNGLLWDHQTGRAGTVLNEKVFSVAFSPDGEELTASTENEIVVWSIRSRREVRRTSMPGPSRLNYSPNGRHLLVDGPQQICVLQSADGHAVFCVPKEPKSLVNSGFSSQGDKLIVFLKPIGESPGKIDVWDVSTGSRDREFPTPATKYAAIPSPVGETVALTGVSSTVLYNWRTGEPADEIFSGMGGPGTAFSPDGGLFALTSVLDSRLRLWDLKTGQEKWEIPVGGLSDQVNFSRDGRLLFLTTLQETDIWEVATQRLLCSLFSFSDGSWAVTDAEGRYDAANPDEAAGLHWVAGLDVIELAQLKQRFYTPGLFARVLRGEKLPEVASIQTVKLPPALEVQTPAAGGTQLSIKVTNRGGGIGRIVVKVNGKELASDARGSRTDSNLPSAQFAVDLAGAVRAADGRNRIEVVAYDGANLVSSRGFEVPWTTVAEPAPKPPRLFALVAGVSEYDNAGLNLKYAAKDAETMAQALRLGAKGLDEQVSMHLLTTSGLSGSVLPTKAEFRKAFESIAQQAESQDVLVIYLAGHGVARRGVADQYFFLTQSARSTELPANDSAMLDLAAISSEELKEWCKRIRALKQVIILDTCAAGAAGQELIKIADRRDLSPDQIRAVELLKDSTGSHILMGSAADAVSYEAGRYGQGLLTYALLEGMKGAALEDGQRVDVRKLFDFAQREVEQLARGIGGIQAPLVSSPQGRSFPIGFLSDVDKRAIPLATPKPQLLQVECRDASLGDPAGLTARVRSLLREASQPVTRGQSRPEPAIVYLDGVTDELPGALSPRVLYQIAGGSLEATLHLYRDNQPLTDQKLTTPADPAAAAAAIAQAIIHAAAQAGPR